MKSRPIDCIKEVGAYIPAAVMITIFNTSIALIVLAKWHYEAKISFSQDSLSVTVISPAGKPRLSQESVETALEIFNIKVPSNTERPIFDPTLEDRGITTMKGWGTKLEVAVGPAAFESWALLGSTLAHELEVHCQQSFTLIRIKDIAGMAGTLDAERDAYQHELEHAKRFGLNPTEILNIRATMDFYYPSDSSSKSTLSAH